MADPRKTTSFNEVDAHYSTYAIDNSTITYDGTKANGFGWTHAGRSVALSADKTVKLAGDGDRVIGRIDGVESDNFCRVQDDGYMPLPGGSGASLTRGKSIVGAVDGSSNPGFIREAASGTAAELVKDSGVIVDNSDTAAVIVQF
jgi:hypothetical protein